MNTLLALDTLNEPWLDGTARERTAQTEERNPLPTLSLIIPTFNERQNVEQLLDRIEFCLRSVAWEVVVVDDDSPDGTSEVVECRGQRDPRIRCLRRVDRRGLASACLEGMALARGSILAVMDADLQHDERLLPAMLRAIEGGGADVAVGSRYMPSGSIGAWSRRRLLMSRTATAVTRLLLKVELSDPMSGFFMLRAQVFQQVEGRISERGFKVLLDLLSSSPRRLRVVELPYTFAPRKHGKSKLDAGVVWHFGRLLVSHWVRRISGPMGRFCLVGAHGVLVHVAILDLAQLSLSLSFAPAQAVAVAVSMVSNFALNNRLTFGQAPVQGRPFLAGLLRFAALCSLGALVNVIVAFVVLQLSGERLLAAVAGISAGAICNYGACSLFVWNPSTKARC